MHRRQDRKSAAPVITRLLVMATAAAVCAPPSLHPDTRLPEAVQGGNLAKVELPHNCRSSECLPDTNVSINNELRFAAKQPAKKPH